jgi:hypothetical protein
MARQDTVEGLTKKIQTLSTEIEALDANMRAMRQTRTHLVAERELARQALTHARRERAGQIVQGAGLSEDELAQAIALLRQAQGDDLPPGAVLEPSQSATGCDSRGDGL